MYTYTNHHEIPCMFQMFQHARPSRNWAIPLARLSRITRAFRNTPRVPYEVAKLLASLNPVRITKPVLGSPNSCSNAGQLPSCRTRIWSDVNEIFQPWWGESAHRAFIKRGSTMEARVYRALAGEVFFCFFCDGFFVQKTVKKGASPCPPPPPNSDVRIMTARRDTANR